MNELAPLLSLKLRVDLTMEPMRPDVDGSEGWILQDPLQHRYFRIDQETFELFSLWQVAGSLGEAIADYEDASRLIVEEDQLKAIADFALSGNLVDQTYAGQWRSLADRLERSQPHWAQRLAHQYLFFKVPLLQPQQTLEATLPYVRPLLSKKMALVVACVALLGLYLVSRQWETFVGSVFAALTPLGATGFALAVIVLKALHELGHAYMAVKFGRRVPVLGVAFMMLTPLLYSDVSDAWTLRSRKKRLLISAGGILVELSVAAFATLLWVFLPDGTLRSIAFMMATTAWMMSVVINLNPFMRFDGYYLLSDLLGMENLQPRAFALARWKLRQWLIAPDLQPPETLPRKLEIGLIFYGWMTWIYRLFLFFGIALMVYHFAFKLLGIILFALEIGLLIVIPVFKELKQWPNLYRDAGARYSRIRWTMGLGAICLILIATPIPGHVTAPAVLVASDLTQIYAERSGQIRQINALIDATVEKGALLFTLGSPQLDHDIKLAQIKRDVTRYKLNRSADHAKSLQQSLVLKEELTSRQTSLDGLSGVQQDLHMRAPIHGQIIQIAPDLHEGLWVQRGALLGLMASGDKQVVRGFISETDLERMADAPSARFVPDNLQLKSFPLTLSHVAASNSAVIDIPELTSPQKGPISVSAQGKRKDVPLKAYYRIDFTPTQIPFQPNRVIRGLVHLDAKAESVLFATLRQISRILIRESGF